MIGLRERVRTRPRLCAALVALAASSLLLLAAGALLFNLEWRDARLSLERSRETIAGVNSEIDRLFAQLDKLSVSACSADELIRLRALLLDYRYLRDIGLYDAAGRLYCTTGLGLAHVPIIDPPSLLIDARGQLLWLDMPLLLSGGTTRAMVVRRGDFNVVIDPFISRQFGAGDSDALWFVRNWRIYELAMNPAHDSLTRAALRERARRAAQRLDVAWQGGSLIFTSAIGATGFVAQIARNPTQIIARQRIVIGAALALAALIGLLAYFALLPLLRRSGGLSARLPRLCQSKHIRCLYQPIIDLRTRRVVGCEVLMRLTDGEEVILPDQAIPGIIAKGLCWELDRIVSTKAVEELRLHLPPDLPFKLAFNFFPDNLARADFRSHLEALKTRATPGMRLNIEITEYSFAPQIISTLQELKSAGYAISVDDFGTGYSNLGIVKRVAPDYLKIDKSFVFEMEDASLRSNLIPEIVGIARAVNAEVIGEGVENARQADALAALGVACAQGYFFARPMPVGEFMAWLTTQVTSDALTTPDATAPGAVPPKVTFADGTAHPVLTQRLVRGPREGRVHELPPGSSHAPA